MEDISETGPYEIMPYKDIVNMKKELEELRKKTGEAPSRELLKSMDNLTKNMDSMLSLFKSAAEEMKVEEKTPEIDFKPVNQKISSLVDRMDEMSNKIDELFDQNKTIAEGIVAVSDSLDEKFSSLESEGGKPEQPKPSSGPRGPMPPTMRPGPGTPVHPGAIEGSMSARGPVPSRLPKRQGPAPSKGPIPPSGKPTPQGPPSGPPGAPPGKPTGGPIPPPGQPSAGGPGKPQGKPAPPGKPPEKPPKKGLFGLGKK